jgi:hypothetical protein
VLNIIQTWYLIYLTISGLMINYLSFVKRMHHYHFGSLLLINSAVTLIFFLVIKDPVLELFIYLGLSLGIPLILVDWKDVVRLLKKTGSHKVKR